MTLYTDVNDHYLTVQVTVENMEAVARWCKGVVRTSGGFQWIELYETGDEYQAHLSDWIVLRMGISLKCYFDVYSNEDFNDLYREV